MTVIDTPAGIHYFGLLQVAHRLALEINTGMKFRQSTLTAAKRAGLTKAGTKKGALRDVVAHLEGLNAGYEAGETITRALA